MPFLLFLILILLLVNGVAVFKFMYRTALFVIFFIVVGLTSYFVYGMVSDEEPLAPVVAEVMNQAQDEIRTSQLEREIKRLRQDMNEAMSLSEKKTLMKHLQLLEKLQQQQRNEKEALANLERDRAKLQELQRLKDSVEERRKKMEADAKRLKELAHEIKRSEKLIEKLNSVDNLEKGIKHD